MKRIFKLSGLLLLGLVFFINGNGVHAAGKNQNADFEVKPMFDTSQTNSALNYFNLKYKPGTKHEIKLQIQNYTEHEITIRSQFRNAVTDYGGVNAFTPEIKNLDPTLKTPLTEVVKLNGSKKLVLKPEEIRYITATVQMPKNKFRGMIYGDWHFIEYLKNNNNDRSSATSNYAYSIGVILQGEHYRVYPEIKYIDTASELYQGHPAIMINVRNNQPMVLNHVSMKATIEKKGIFASKRLYEATNRVINPNSKMSIPVSWDYDRLKPGNYEARVKIKGENYWNHLPMTWTINRKFTIRRSEADAINKQALKKPINRWAVVAVASGVALLISSSALIVLLKHFSGV